VDLNELLYGTDATKGDLEAITFNPTASTILKWVRFKFVRSIQYLHHSAFLTNGLGLVSIVVPVREQRDWFTWLHRIPSSADVTMET
jgi:hypothetical protein